MTAGTALAYLGVGGTTWASDGPGQRSWGFVGRPGGRGQIRSPCAAARAAPSGCQPHLCLLLQVLLLLCWSHCSLSPSAGLLVYFGYGIWHSKENLREPQLQRVSAHYVVFPSGSLEETVQAVQPSPQPAAGLPDTDTDEAKR